MWPLKSGLWLLERLGTCPSEYKACSMSVGGEAVIQTCFRSSVLVLCCSGLFSVGNSNQWSTVACLPQGQKSPGLGFGLSSSLN